MSNQQPEALRLADELGACPTINYRRHAETLRRQHAEIERLTVERDAAIDARRAAQLRQEQLTAEIVSLEPMRQRAADIERLTAERDALRAELAEQEVARRIGCACTPDFYLASYAGGAAPGGIYSWARMGLQRTTDAATSWVEYVPAKDAQATAPELLACLIDARDDVAAELQRCREAAGYPSTDRRLAAQETLIARVDAAIAAAEDQPPAPPVKRLTPERISDLEDGFGNEFGLESKYSADFARAIEAACAAAWGVKLEGDGA